MTPQPVKPRVLIVDDHPANRLEMDRAAHPGGGHQFLTPESSGG